MAVSKIVANGVLARPRVFVFKTRYSAVNPEASLSGPGLIGVIYYYIYIYTVVRGKPMAIKD